MSFGKRVQRSVCATRGLLLAPAAIALVAIALAGCGGGGEAGSSSGEGPPAKQKQGGTLNVAQGEEVITLDPLNAFVPSDINAVSQISETLFKENFEGKLAPWLVEKYETSEQDRVWTLHLRKGVDFSSGAPMTSADVVFSLERTRGNESWDSFTEGIEAITAPNPETVVIKNKVSAPELDAILGLWPFAIVPKNLGGESEKEFGQHPIGTGPFMFGSWKHGETMTFVRNPHYWQAGLPYLDELKFQTVTDPQSRVSQLLAGQLQTIASPPWAQVEAIESSPETQTAPSPPGFVEMLELNAQDPLFQNKKVREAADIAMDREGMVNTVLLGNGQTAGPFVPPPQRFHDASIKAPEQDIAKAKELLAEAVKEGVEPTMTILVPNEDDFWPTASQIAQQNLEEAGFTVKLQKLETSSWLEILGSGKFDATFGFAYCQMLSPSELFAFYNGFNGFNTFADTTKTKALLAKALSSVDPKEREKFYFQMQAQLNEEKFLIPVAYKPYMWATGKEVEGFYVGVVGIPWFAQTSLG